MGAALLRHLRRDLESWNGVVLRDAIAEPVRRPFPALLALPIFRSSCEKISSPTDWPKDAT
jgi:hypothetical protein